MNQVTVRRVQDRCLELARQKARERCVSMNTVLLEALESGLGMKSEVLHHDLDSYAGTADFGPDCDRFLQVELNQIDEDSWK